MIFQNFNLLFSAPKEALRSPPVWGLCLLAGCGFVRFKDKFVCVCMYLSVCLCLLSDCMSVSFMYMSICLCLLCICLYVCVSMFLYMCLCFSHSLTVSVDAMKDDYQRQLEVKRCTQFNVST